MIASQASIPWMFGGLWRGAILAHSSKASITAGVINTESANFSAPWTTRWPTASISSMEEITPNSASTKMSSKILSACLWSKIGSTRSNFSASGRLWVKIASSAPIFSNCPFANTASLSMSMSWYFKEELPQFTTKTFITYPSFLVIWILPTTRSEIWAPIVLSTGYW